MPPLQPLSLASLLSTPLVVGVALSLGFARPAFAGPTLDESVARHRALVDRAGSGRGLAPIELDAGLPDGATFAVGGNGVAVPSLVRPMALGDGGVVVRASRSFESEVRVRLGAAWQAGDDHPYTLDGSAASVPLGAGRLYASIERRHWGPSWTNSLILDGGSRPVPAVGWRKTDAAPFRSRWLSWLGPWSADVFAGELSQRSGPHRPHLFGARVQVMPIEGLELGASRTLQWGGDGRSESLGSFWRALIGRDNGQIGNDFEDPSNQLAGFDARYTLHWGDRRSASAYLQVIGEDEAGYLPSHRFAAYGVDASWPIGAGTVRAFAEYANTTARGGFGATPMPGITYRHGIYSDGYTQLGRPLGHPAGGDIRLASLGALFDLGAWRGVVVVHRGSAYPTATLYPGGGRLQGGNAEIAWQVDAASRLGVALAHWRAPGLNETRAQAWWQYAWP